MILLDDINLSEKVVFDKLHDKVVLDASLHLGDEADRARVWDVQLLCGLLWSIFLPQYQKIFVDASRTNREIKKSISRWCWSRLVAKNCQFTT